MKYNYSKLLGKIKEKGLTQSQVAEAIGKNESTLSIKLNGKFFFTTAEIDAICDLLDIAPDEIGSYFFAK
jgi:transcriptional regulator with XRE-family HTH domain